MKDKQELIRFVRHRLAVAQTRVDEHETARNSRPIDGNVWCLHTGMKFVYKESIKDLEQILKALEEI